MTWHAMSTIPYSMEPFEGWERGPGYNEKKRISSDKLYEALERVIPDIRERVLLEMIGSPLTHQFWNRRYKVGREGSCPPHQFVLPVLNSSTRVYSMANDVASH